jgi:REP element-mobilizing transposase RayT
MRQSLVQNYLHIIFHTKKNSPLIVSEFEVLLYEYLGGICKNLGSSSIIIGGYIDHVHI